MPRSKRILYDNAVYHIVQRGHNKDNLFKRAADYRIFKDIIRKYKGSFVFNIYHYCLMPNHMHILMKVEKGKDLPRIMQGVTQSYSFYYRKVYDHSGYVYQNRYKDFLVKDDSYLLECGRYIERNPLRAGMVRDLSQYQWSSYGVYAHGISDDIVTMQPLYETLGGNAYERIENYRQYLKEERPYERVLDEAVVG